LVSKPSRLHEAAYHGDLSLVKSILEENPPKYDIDVQTRAEKITPLHEAAFMNQGKMRK